MLITRTWLMGARHALAAFERFAGRVPATPMIVLVLMATLSSDDDPDPCFDGGHEMLAAVGLGRPAPATEADLRAVERAAAQLFAAGAITTIRRPGRHAPAHYRLNLAAVPAPSPAGAVEAGCPICSAALAARERR